MSDSGLSRAEQIFLDACELDAPERAAFLASACAGDDALQKEVESLLDAAEGSEDYFGGLAGRVGLADALERERGARDAGNSGDRIGPYRLTERIGTGGMGTVWCAERSDGRFEGRVAVKLLTGWAQGATLRRFDREAHYLAKLTHPNIARLIDAGVGQDDIPYLILEFVEGVTIDRYCDSRSLSIEERVRLFIGVLDAVAHAHTHLIVHNDIKPSNVLVDGDGAVKLLDFGIARLLSESDEADGVALRQRHIALTPEFAAPEQMTDAAITTATDVYSLGLLLYELLTGSSPRRLDAVTSMDELRAAAMREPPPLASTITDAEEPSLDHIRRLARQRRASPQRLLRTLRGDLDQVVGKALAVDPRKRYLTAADFASDLRRYLKCQTVSARPETFAYSAARFVQRHRGGVLSAALTMLALISAAVITAWQSVEAQRQRDLALAEQQRAQSTNSFMNLLLTQLGSDGEAFTAVELLDRGVDMLEQRHQRNIDFVGTAYYDIAQHYANLGSATRADDLLARVEAIAREDGDANLLARTLCSIVQRRYRTDPADARARFAEASTLLAAARQTPVLTMTTCARAGSFIFELDGEPAAALELLEDALERLEQSPLVLTETKAALLGHIGSLHHKAGRIDQTLEINARALETLRLDAREDSLGYLITSMNQATLLQNVGEIGRAHALRVDILARMQALDARGRAPSYFWSQYASSLNHLAQHDEALEVLTRYRAQAQNAGDEEAVALFDIALGATYAYLQQPDAAYRYLDAADAFFRPSAGSSHRLLFAISVNRLRAYLAEGHVAEAQRLVDSLLAEADYPARSDAPNLAYLLIMAARVADAAGDPSRAERLATDAHGAAVRIARDAGESAIVGWALLLRAQARIRLDRPEDAAHDLEAALPSLANGLANDHPDAVEARRLLDDLTG